MPLLDADYRSLPLSQYMKVMLSFSNTYGQVLKPQVSDYIVTAFLQL